MEMSNEILHNRTLIIIINDVTCSMLIWGAKIIYELSFFRAYISGDYRLRFLRMLGYRLATDHTLLSAASNTQMS